MGWQREAAWPPRVRVAFDVPAGHGEHISYGGSNNISVSFKGRVYADEESKAVLRVETHAVDLPKEVGYQGIDLTLDYRAAKIGNREFALPYRFDGRWNGRVRMADVNIRAEYKDYHPYAIPPSTPPDTGDAGPSSISFGNGN